jgi:hypothetical protein
VVQFIMIKTGVKYPPPTPIMPDIKQFNDPSI